jgi:sec-independent protein translocase protein TatA
VHVFPPAEIFGVDGIVVLVVVAAVLFGSSQIPKLARSLGSAQKEFKKGAEEHVASGEPSRSSSAEARVPASLPAPAMPGVDGSPVQGPDTAAVATHDARA